MLNYVMESAHVSGGWLALAAVGVAVLAYFLGCFNGAVVVSRYILRDDVRNHGSGNAGLTNFYRTFGGPLTLVVILSDAVKAVVAVLFAMWIAHSISPELVTLSKYWAGLFCLLGHMFPCMFGFKGGKGVLVCGGAILALQPLVFLALLVIFLIEFAITRIVSLGSIILAAIYPVLTICYWVWQGADLFTLVYIGVCSAIMALMVIYMHRSNIQRLRAGTEYRFGEKKNRE